MMALPIFVVAALVGVVLAVVDGPYAYDKSWVEKLSAVAFAGVAAVVAAGGALMVRGWILD